VKYLQDSQRPEENDLLKGVQNQIYERRFLLADEITRFYSFRSLKMLRFKNEKENQKTICQPAPAAWDK